MKLLFINGTTCRMKNNWQDRAKQKEQWCNYRELQVGQLVNISLFDVSLDTVTKIFFPRKPA